MTVVINPYRFATSGGGGGGTTFVGSSKVTASGMSGGTSTFNIPVPAGTSNGDLVVVAAVTRNSYLSTPSTVGPQGGTAFTLIKGVGVGSGGISQDPWTGSPNEEAGFWWKVAGGSEPANYTIDVADSGGDGQRFICMVFRGPTTLAGSAIAGGTLTAPSVTWSADDVVVAAYTSSFESSDFTGAESGYTIAENGVLADGGDATIILGTYQIPESGGSGTATAVGSGVNAYLVAIHLVFS